jgi:hypothetical protein
MLIIFMLTVHCTIQKAADNLAFLLRAPGNCLNVIADLPANAPSKNLAALWIRAVFHDAGTWDQSTKTGGADGSLEKFVNDPLHVGLPDTLASKFKFNIGTNLSSGRLYLI